MSNLITLFSDRHHPALDRLFEEVDTSATENRGNYMDDLHEKRSNSPKQNASGLTVKH